MSNVDPLQKLREPFAPNHISKLPKPTKAQTEAVRDNFKAGVRCRECGSWHHPDVVHLDYVGHAALTDRLLDVDPHWSWEPVAFADGLPAFDKTGGLWIKLTVCGVTRLGYGHAAAKPNADPGAREKEVIGDALRNAAMRFGAALDLWHKGDLHADEPSAEAPSAPRHDPPPSPPRNGTPAKRNDDELALATSNAGYAIAALKKIEVGQSREFEEIVKSDRFKKLRSKLECKFPDILAEVDAAREAAEERLDDVPY